MRPWSQAKSLQKDHLVLQLVVWAPVVPPVTAGVQSERTDQCTHICEATSQAVHVFQPNGANREGATVVTVVGVLAYREGGGSEESATLMANIPCLWCGGTRWCGKWLGKNHF